MSSKIILARNVQIEGSGFLKELDRELGDYCIVDDGSTDYTFDVICSHLDGVNSKNGFWLHEGEFKSGVQLINALTDSTLESRSLEIRTLDKQGLSPALVMDDHQTSPTPAKLKLRPIFKQEMCYEADFRDAIVCFPSARYHVDELAPLALALENLGFDVWLVLPETNNDAIRTELRRYDVRVAPWPVEDTALDRALGLITLNDWGPVRRMIDRCRGLGIPTFAKVEGVQDFEDVDTGRERHPYRRSDFVLCQGQNDVKNLPTMRTSVVGNSRLERIHQITRNRSSSNNVVINSNFTYNVMTDQRDNWLSSALKACAASGVSPTISQHHADGQLSEGLPISKFPIRHLLTSADILISRFSTVPFEAMARGVTFIYHNPHREKVPTFLCDSGSFYKTSDTSSLKTAIEEALSIRPDLPRDSTAFFNQQISITEEPSEYRSANFIKKMIDLSRKWGTVTNVD